MSEKDIIILAIKGLISELSPDKQRKCQEFESLISEASKGHEGCMILVLALMSETLQAQAQ
jgi:hypothetical protein